MIIVVGFVGGLSLESQERRLERECGGFLDIAFLNFDGTLLSSPILFLLF